MANRHNVCWGTHACYRHKGHANPCRCDCGEWLPTGHLYVFGDDKESAVFNPKKHV